MEVVILCGGQGTRLREETEYRPKPMVDVGGRPILWHIMKTYSHFGYRDFILCLGYKQELIREYFMNYRWMNSDVTVDLASQEMTVRHRTHAEDWRVTLVDTGKDTKKGGRLRKIQPYISGGLFMMTYGDGVADIDIHRLTEHHRRAEALVTFTGVHPISRFATVETDRSGAIVDWEEKKVLEGYINGGFFMLDKRVFDYIAGDCEFEEEPMRRLAQERRVTMFRHEGFWHCMDTYRDYLLLNEMWANGSAPWKRWDED